MQGPSKRRNTSSSRSAPYRQYANTGRRVGPTQGPRPVVPPGINNPNTRLALASMANDVRTCEISPAPFIVPTAGNTFIYPLNAIPQGAAVVNRQGNDISLRSLRVRGGFQMAQQTNFLDQKSNFLRLTVVYDSQPAANPPLRELMFSYTTLDALNQPVATFDLFAPVNILQTRRFKILADQTFNHGALIELIQSYAGIRNFSGTFDMYVKLRGLSTSYSANSTPAVVGDIRTGAIYFVATCLNNDTTQNISLDFGSRLRFYG